MYLSREAMVDVLVQVARSLTERFEPNQLESLERNELVVRRFLDPATILRPKDEAASPSLQGLGALGEGEERRLLEVLAATGAVGAQIWGAGELRSQAELLGVADVECKKYGLSSDVASEMVQLLQRAIREAPLHAGRDDKATPASDARTDEAANEGPSPILSFRIYSNVEGHDRLGPTTPVAEKSKVAIWMDEYTGELFIHGRPVDLKSVVLERLLSHILRHMGRRVARESIFRDVWQQEYLGPSSDHNISSHLTKLQKKIGYYLWETKRDASYYDFRTDTSYCLIHQPNSS